MIDARTLAERVFTVIDGQRWADYETVMHPDVEMTSPFATLHSAAEWAEFSRSFAVAMPDGAHTVTRVVQVAGTGSPSRGSGPAPTPGRSARRAARCRPPAAPSRCRSAPSGRSATDGCRA